VSDPRWHEELKDTKLRDEIDRSHPERTKLRPTDVAGLQEAFAVVEAIWAPTIERARALPPELMHERVNGEYSFIETFRHLLFAWEVWLRDVMQIPDGFHEWALPPDLPADVSGGVKWAPGENWTSTDAPPELEPVLDVRAEHLARVRTFLASATPDDLKQLVSPPPWVPDKIPALAGFGVVLREEWWHHQYASRDLALLSAH